jgi:lipid-binding SYLF domain-containing protein
VFLVPDHVRGAVLVGGAGGQGVLLVKHDSRWIGPVFYNFGSLSLGAQAGGSAGQIAMILLSDKAVNGFKGDNSFSLNADAGLSLINWSARSQASMGTTDVIFWSDAEGAYAGAALGVADINADESANRAFYNAGKANPERILTGDVKPADPATARKLRQALPA